MTSTIFSYGQRLTRGAAIVLVASAASSAAMAEAVTYHGTLGKIDIILEVNTPVTAPGEKFVGRYSYMSEGVDIPLQPIKIAPGKVELGEEKPCTPETCSKRFDDPQLPAPIGGHWSLTTKDDGATLTGEWTDEKGSKSLPIELKRYGTRMLDEGAFAGEVTELTDIVDLLSRDDHVLLNEASPYDFLKTQVKLEESPETVFGEAAVVYMTDPRTKFPFPRIKRVSAAGTENIELANSYLDYQHWLMNLEALSCKAGQYFSFGWHGVSELGTLGGYDEESVTVSYLSPTILSWSQNGSLWCDGASPYNHIDEYTLDVRTGEPLDISRILKGWIATEYSDELRRPVDLETARRTPDKYRWVPDAELAAYVDSHRPRSGPDYYAEDEEACTISESIKTQLKVSFAQDGEIVFSLEGYRSDQAPCEGMVLMVVAPQDIKELLAPTAVEYFPQLSAAK
jgi:hypothetical protein